LGAELRPELVAHGRRARLAHRALLVLYAGAAVLLIVILALGAALEWTPAQDVALYSAFAGAGLLFTATALLAAETWIGVTVIDQRIERVIRRCR